MSEADAVGYLIILGAWAVIGTVAAYWWTPALLLAAPFFIVAGLGVLAIAIAGPYFIIAEYLKS